MNRKLIQIIGRPLGSLRYKNVTAEREGFEPSVPFLTHSLSRTAVSTAHAPLLDALLFYETRHQNTMAVLRRHAKLSYNPYGVPSEEPWKQEHLQRMRSKRYADAETNASMGRRGKK